MATDRNYPEAVAETVHRAIRAAGRTPESVADEIGMAPRTFYRLLRNQNLARSFQVRELDLIAKALDLPVSALLPEVAA